MTEIDKDKETLVGYRNYLQQIGYGKVSKYLSVEVLYENDLISKEFYDSEIRRIKLKKLMNK